MAGLLSEFLSLSEALLGSLKPVDGKSALYQYKQDDERSDSWTEVLTRLQRPSLSRSIADQRGCGLRCVWPWQHQARL